MVKHNRIESWVLLKEMDNISSFDAISSIHKMNTCVFLKSPLDIVEQMTWILKLLHVNHVPLHKPSQRFKFLNNIIEWFFFTINLYVGKPTRFKVCRKFAYSLWSFRSIVSLIAM